MTGVVKEFNLAKGFGFVANEGGSFFFHVTGLFGDVAAGDSVEFALDDDPRRPGQLKAVDVQKIGSAPTVDRLFFANVPFAVSEAELTDCFGQYGAVVKLELIRDERQESRGWGFVQMADAQAAQLAIQGLDGQDWDGRRIFVKQARQRRQ